MAIVQGPGRGWAGLSAAWTHNPVTLVDPGEPQMLKAPRSAPCTQRKHSMTQVRLYQLLPHTSRDASCPRGKAPVFVLRVTQLPWAQSLPLLGLFSPQPQPHPNPTSPPPAGPLHLLWPLPDALSAPHLPPSQQPLLLKQPFLQEALPDLQGHQIPRTGSQITSAPLPRRPGFLLR